MTKKEFVLIAERIGTSPDLTRIGKFRLAEHFAEMLIGTNSRFDKKLFTAWVLTIDRNLTKPKPVGPEENIGSI